MNNHNVLKRGDRVSVQIFGVNNTMNIIGEYVDYSEGKWITLTNVLGYVEGTMLIIPWHAICTISWGDLNYE